MQKMKKIPDAMRRSKIVRYRAYKKIGVVKHRKHLDRTVLFFTLVLLTFLTFFLIKPESDLPQTTSSDLSQVMNQDAQETIHGDFGDPPIESDQEASLSDLEKRAALGELTLSHLTLEKGGSILGLLGQAGVSAQERIDVTDALSLLVDLKSVRPGVTIMVFQTKENEFLGMTLNIKESETFAVLKEEDGSFTPVTHEGRVETVTQRVQGTIERTFSGSAQKAGLSAQIISQITGALDGEVDFSSDFNAGDTFDVIVEKKMTASGLELGSRQVVFIGLKITGKKDINRYAYTDKSGTLSFYDAKGKSGQKMLYKRPLKARPRLSSPYGNRRHPVLLYEVFHSGVDLAAPKNTPIFAAADGVITQLGRKGAYGKYIRVRHDNTYQTAYAHMNGYRSGLKVGSKVKRGEVIGYVGSTGRSTGPHLHFEVWKNGKTMNPLGDHVIPSKNLSGFELEQFQFFAEGLHPNFKEHLAGNMPPVPSFKPEFK